MGFLWVIEMLPIPIPTIPMGKTHTGYPYLCISLHTAKEALWLHKFIHEVFPKILILPTTIHCNNQAAIKLITTDNYHSRTKHLYQWYHFICDIASKGTIKLMYCPTDDMVADVLMKALPKWKVAVHANTLGMCHACGGVME
jgi:hypothetical protein